MLDKRPEISWMMGKCNLFGRVGMIIFWYWDGSDDAYDAATALEAIAILPDLLSGQTEDFSNNDWFIFWDALGSYPHRDEELGELYQITRDGFFKELPPGPTKCFLIIDPTDGIIGPYEDEDEE